MTNRERIFSVLFFFIWGGGGEGGGEGGLVNKLLDGCGLLELHISVPLSIHMLVVSYTCFAIFLCVFL